MKLDNIRGSVAEPSLPNTKSYAPYARSSLQNSGLASPLPPRPSAGGEERRRSQRVLLRVRANIHVALQGESATIEVLTQSVSPHGALVVMKRSLPIETRLVLEHSGTRERVACKVVRSGREMSEGYHVPIEFDSPAPDFWKIVFPPLDWRPDDD